MRRPGLVLFGVLLGAWPGTAAGQGAMAKPSGVELFAGPDGSKQPQDLGVNAHMGLRLSADWWRRRTAGGLGIQAGIGLNLSDAAVHVLDQIGGPSRRTQLFVTAGVFQRRGRVSWSAAWDHLRQAYYDTSNLDQVRAQVGIGVSESDEIGGWVSAGVRGADAVALDTPVRLDPIAQAVGYARRTWPTGGETTVWAGWAEGHDNVVLVFEDDTRSAPVFVYGAGVHLPLDDRFAIVGAANFITPAATGTVDAYLGVAFHPGGGARGGRASRPFFSVANNPAFPINLKR
ncbi:MAG: DUF6666 family protein [Vicinamibacterales bacterium]